MKLKYQKAKYDRTNFHGVSANLAWHAVVVYRFYENEGSLT